MAHLPCNCRLISLTRTTSNGKGNPQPFKQPSISRWSRGEDSFDQKTKTLLFLHYLASMRFCLNGLFFVCYNNMMLMMTNTSSNTSDHLLIYFSIVSNSCIWKRDMVMDESIIHKNITKKFTRQKEDKTTEERYLNKTKTVFTWCNNVNRIVDCDQKQASKRQQQQRAAKLWFTYI